MRVKRPAGIRSPPRARIIHPDYVVDVGLEGGPQHRETFRDLPEWYAVLRRPPETWSVHETATWLWMPPEHGGAGMPDLAPKLVAGCIDGHLLLNQIGETELKVSLGMRDAQQRQRLLQAVQGLRQQAAAIAAGEVLVPIPMHPPKPVQPTTRERLLQGLPLPRRRKRLPWDRDIADGAVVEGRNALSTGYPGAQAGAQPPAAAGATTAAGAAQASPVKAAGPQGAPQLPPGRVVTFSQREAMLAAAQEAARALRNADLSARPAAPLVGAAVAGGMQAQAQEARLQEGVGAPPTVQAAVLQLMENLGKLGELRAEYEALTIKTKLAHRGSPGMTDREMELVLGSLAGEESSYEEVEEGEQYKAPVGDAPAVDASLKGLPQPSSSAPGAAAGGHAPAATAGRRQEGTGATVDYDDAASVRSDASFSFAGPSARPKVRAQATAAPQPQAGAGLRPSSAHQPTPPEGSASSVSVAGAAAAAGTSGQPPTRGTQGQGGRRADPAIDLMISELQQQVPELKDIKDVDDLLQEGLDLLRQAKAQRVAHAAATGLTPANLSIEGSLVDFLYGSDGSDPEAGQGLGGAPGAATTMSVGGMAGSAGMQHQQHVGQGQRSSGRFSGLMAEAESPAGFASGAAAWTQGVQVAGGPPGMACAGGAGVAAGTSLQRRAHRLRQLAAVKPHERGPGGPYSREVHEQQQPDVYGTRDMDQVKKVLRKGMSTRVQHTLKSQLAEDFSRHAHGLPARVPGFEQSARTRATIALADREVELRLAQGIPVTQDLYLDTIHTGPLSKPIVIKVPRRHQYGTPLEELTEGQAVTKATGNSRSPSTSPARRRPLSSPAGGSERPQSSPAGGVRMAGAGAAGSPARGARHRASLPGWLQPDGTWGHAETHQMLHRALEMLEAPSRPPAGPAGTGMYAFPPGGTRLTARPPQYRGRKPVWDARPPVKYDITGWSKGADFGHPLTKQDAERIARRVHDGTRGNTVIHFAAQAGDAQDVADQLFRAYRRQQQLKQRGKYGRSRSQSPGAYSSSPGGTGRSRSGSPGSRGASSSRSASASPVHGLARPMSAPHAEQQPLSLKAAMQHRQLPGVPPLGFADAAAVIPGQKPGPAPSGAPPPHPWVRVDPMRELIERSRVRNDAGESALHKAAQSKERTLGIIQHLLAAGADANAQDAYGETPAMSVLTSGAWLPEGPARIRELLQRGKADPNIADANGETLLHKAIIHGVCSGGGPGLGAAPMPLRGKHLQNALAAAKGSIPLAVAKHKAAHQRVVMAGLHDASMQPMGLSDLVRMLLNHGAKVDARNVRGHTPLHMAAMKPHRHSPGQASCSLMVLLQEGADPNARDVMGRSPLHYAIIQAVEAHSLLEANRINHHKHATSRPNEDPKALLWVTRVLLASKSDPNAQDELGRTPLHLATAARNTGLVQLLARFGGDPLLPDANGDTPAGIAKAQKDWKGLEALQHHAPTDLSSDAVAPATMLTLQTAASPWEGGTVPSAAAAAPKPSRPAAPKRPVPVAAPAPPPAAPVTVGAAPKGGKAALKEQELARLRQQHAAYVISDAGETSASEAEGVSSPEKGTAHSLGGSAAQSSRLGGGQAHPVALAQNPGLAAKASRVEQEAAAARIQAVYRGRKAREEVGALRKQQPAQGPGRAGTKAPSAVVGQPSGPGQKQQEQAAIKIQSAYRGRKAREHTRQLTKQQKEQQLKAIGLAPSQAAQKQHAGPPIASHVAATRIQAAYRGRKARKDFDALRKQQQQQQSQAASARPPAPQAAAAPAAAAASATAGSAQALPPPAVAAPNAGRWGLDDAARARRRQDGPAAAPVPEPAPPAPAPPPPPAPVFKHPLEEDSEDEMMAMHGALSKQLSRTGGRRPVAAAGAAALTVAADAPVAAPAAAAGIAAQEQVEEEEESESDESIGEASVAAISVGGRSKGGKLRGPTSAGLQGMLSQPAISAAGPAAARPAPAAAMDPWDIQSLDSSLGSADLRALQQGDDGLDSADESGAGGGGGAASDDGSVF